MAKQFFKCSCLQYRVLVLSGFYLGRFGDMILVTNVVMFGIVVCIYFLHHLPFQNDILQHLEGAIDSIANYWKRN